MGTLPHVSFERCIAHCPPVQTSFACPANLPQGQGLSPRQMRNCDAFIYIPQDGPGTASLNVAVAASIVLHHYALWAGFQERSREGQKYVVDARPPPTRGKGEAAGHAYGWV